MTAYFDCQLFEELFLAIAQGERKIKINGLWGSSEAYFLSCLLAKGIPFCLVTPTATNAQQMCQEINFFAQQGSTDFPLQTISSLSESGPTRPLLPSQAVACFPGWDILPYEPGAPRPDWVAQRLRILHQLALGKAISLVTPVDAFLQKVLDKTFLLFRAITLEEGGTIDREELITRLTQNGYERVETVTVQGEYVSRGGIIDFYSPTEDVPVRIEFFGDTIESLRTFDPATQKSIARIASATLIPGRENLADPIYCKMPLSDYLSPDTLLIYDEPDAVRIKGKQFFQEIEEGAIFSKGKTKIIGVPALPPEHLLGCGAGRTVIDLESLSMGSDRNAKRFMFNIPALSSLGIGRFGQSFAEGVERLNQLRSDHSLVVVVRNQIQMDRFKRIFDDYNLPFAIWDKASAPSFPAPVFLAMGDIAEGFSLPQLKTIFLTDEVLSGHAGKKKGPSKDSADNRSLLFASVSDLQVKDAVVHADHGIGIFLGIKRLSISPFEWTKAGEKFTTDFLMLEYAGGDKLYVPLDALNRVQKYVGSEGTKPPLDKLGGASRWARTKEKVQKAIVEMTQELLVLYAERAVSEGHSFRPTQHLNEFSAAFPYEETPDQLSAIEDIIKDMESEKPMDRLICGDVGYGKTEVAMRAAFLAAMDNKQVAVLVPTTLLAMQHGEGFIKRFAPFPVRVAVLSRFRSAKEQKAILSDLKKGAIDIVVGTHRLLGKDVSFLDIGLVIVDEEHRFGVRHKERLKQYRKEVDVLTLTATPIPRTLQMVMASMRDMSVIETPPMNRLAIRTVVAPFDPKLIREIVFRELVRGGQIFFVHNRVYNITEIGEMLKALIPEAKIGIAHGQMREQELERVIIKFINKEYTLLLTTTIIESGIDIPSANTIIINNADQFGLAELYQLRGRVGRSEEQAYAYLLVQEEAMMTETARKRLAAIQEFTELGAGFKVAARDLEIRGAGSLLGSEQSGQVAAVGFDLYLQMIEEKVSELRGSATQKIVEAKVELKCSAYIPEEYLPDPQQRLTLYRRLSNAKSQSEIDDIQTEFRDRYGGIPEPLAHLLEIVSLKTVACRGHVVKVVQEDKTILFVLDETVPRKEDTLKNLMKKFKNKIQLKTPFSFDLTVNDTSHESVFCEVLDCLTMLAG
jgi:transcription-repair coupling factor (superfamily II helicase)